MNNKNNLSDFSIFDLEAAAAPEIYQRGVEYYQQGHLVKACKIDHILAGVITGTGGIYKIRLWYKHSGLQGECSCPYQGFCKHMVALAIAWLKADNCFIDLQPQLNKILDESTNQTALLLKLIHKDPLNLLELLPEQINQTDFISARGVLNLIRNAFSAPQFSVEQTAGLWEKVNHLIPLIAAKIQANDPQAKDLLLEFITGLEQAFEANPSNSFCEIFKELVHSLEPVLPSLNPNQQRQVFEKIWLIYLNPNLWELALELRPLLICVHQYDVTFLEQKTRNLLSGEPSFLQLISLYLLYYGSSIKDSVFTGLLKKVSAKLVARPDGSLWLIDRFLENEPDQAYRLAKTGMRLFPQDKPAFRERLITIHLKRAELKQAAALSFIQFQENPNFEEYLRLKTLLGKNPSDWERYRKEIMHILATRNQGTLNLQIMIEDQELRGIADNLERIIADDALLMAAAKLFALKIEATFTPLYPIFIKALLDRRGPDDWKTALQLLITFKRYCHFDVAKQEEWLKLREELCQTYRTDIGFLKKFGSILGSY
jgi:hypothetical protein